MGKGLFMGNKFVGFLIAGIAFILASVLMLQFFVKPNPYPEGVVTRLPATGDWIYPQNTAEVLAKELTTEQLIDRWNRWPQKPDKEGFHLVYADALALHGEDAVSAVEPLAKAVKHFDPNLRKSVMKALAAIGEEGIPPLIEALKYWPDEDPNNFGQEIRGDAANYLKEAAREEVYIGLALPTLSAYLVNEKCSVHTRQEAALALSWMGTPEAGEALKKGRDWYFSLDGLTLEENQVLEKINLGLRRLNT